MKIKDLIAELSELDPELDVYIHMDSIAPTGCDVMGADSVERISYPGHPKDRTPVRQSYGVIYVNCYCASDV